MVNGSQPTPRKEDMETTHCSCCTACLRNHERTAVEDLLLRYCYLVDIQDVEGLVGEIFAPDGSDDHGGGPVKGTEALREWFTGTFANVAGSVHALSNILISLTGETAAARSTVTTYSWTRSSDGRGALRPADYVLSAYYVDRLVKTVEGWRILERRLETNGVSVIAQGVLPPTQTGMHALAERVGARSVLRALGPTEFAIETTPTPTTTETDGAHS